MCSIFKKYSQNQGRFNPPPPNVSTQNLGGCNPPPPYFGAPEINTKFRQITLYDSSQREA